MPPKLPIKIELDELVGVNLGQATLNVFALWYILINLQDSKKYPMTTPTRLFDFPYYQLANYPIADAFVTKYNGQWEKTSTQQFIDKANESLVPY